MKQFLMASAQHARKMVWPIQWLTRKNNVMYCLAIVLTAIAFMGCQKQDLVLEEQNIPAKPEITPEVSGRNFLFDYPGLSAQTLWELQQARSATARYRDINHAIADGYQNISVVVPNMGHHFLKSTINDATFDIRQPELLVYNPDEHGNFELVAVEYAVPLNLSATAPSGFTGSGDVWDENTGFGLWLLHAWVWSHNPMGVFNPTNPDVHVH